MITKIFWTVAALDGIAAVVLWKLFQRETVHGLLVIAYLFLLAVIVLASGAFPLLRSDGLRVAAFVVLLLPSAPLVYSAVAAAAKTVREQRQFDGSAYFQGPALALAQAMVKHDVELVKQLIPAAGDLNQPRGGARRCGNSASCRLTIPRNRSPCCGRSSPPGLIPSATAPPIRSSTRLARAPV